MKKETTLKKFGTNLKKIRLSHNLSQEELASACSLHRTYIGMIERGEKNLTLSSMKKISLALDIEISELLKGV